MKPTYIFCIVSILVFGGCQSQEAKPTGYASLDELSSAFRTAYDAGDAEAIARMVEWTNVDSELQEIQMNFLTMFIGVNKVTDISFEPLPDDMSSNPINGREVDLNITPTHLFSVKHAGNGGFEGGASNGSASMPVGMLNGRYYFCGWVYRD